jgi:hypothetical protein
MVSVSVSGTTSTGSSFVNTAPDAVSGQIFGLTGSLKCTTLPVDAGDAGQQDLMRFGTPPCYFGWRGCLGSDCASV